MAEDLIECPRCAGSGEEPLLPAHAAFASEEDGAPALDGEDLVW
jgi:hypothetical protein